jgi:hypothetical protein
MTSTMDQITIWRFADAPEALKSLFNGLKAPAWLALVPRSLRGTAVEAFLQSRLQAVTGLRYETAAKDVVYSGGAEPKARPKAAGRSFGAKSTGVRKAAARTR